MVVQDFHCPLQILKFYPQFVVVLLLVFMTEVAVVVLGYIYRAKVRTLNLSLNV